MAPGYYFATHRLGWRAIVEVRRNNATGTVYVVAMNTITRFAAGEFGEWSEVIEERKDG